MKILSCILIFTISFNAYSASQTKNKKENNTELEEKKEELKWDRCHMGLGYGSRGVIDYYGSCTTEVFKKYRAGFYGIYGSDFHKASDYRFTLEYANELGDVEKGTDNGYDKYELGIVLSPIENFYLLLGTTFGKVRTYHEFHDRTHVRGEHGNYLLRGNSKKLNGLSYGIAFDFTNKNKDKLNFRLQYDPITKAPLIGIGVEMQ